jgi:DNA topoisomerase-1
MKNLFIVESPHKATTIQKFLGSDYEVLSSYGHVRDLAKKDMSIDIENNYEPQYQITEDKQKLVNDLKKAAGKADMVWLASDEDREGEAIAWHLFETLKLDPKKTKRIVFNEITKGVILDALKNPREIDMNLVDAQQARRVLDRLVGYEISPILWQKIKPSLSAGRVQSVAVRLIVEREEEIRNFKSEAYFRTTASFHSQNDSRPLLSEYSIKFGTEEEASAFLSSLKGEQFSVKKVETKPAKRTPAAPFTTSTLQQEASRKLGFSVARTMQIAQQLYESGYITYMRTDSTNLSNMALAMAKEVVSETYGANYSQTRKYTTKVKGAQEAHEAIRPTDLHNITIDADAPLRRLYELIWKRTIASQMANAELKSTIIEIATGNMKGQFECRGEVVVFDGFMKVYTESTDNENEEGSMNDHMLPNVKVGDLLNMDECTSTEGYTQHPARYTEASLVRKLEALGIGRPSTYAPTVSTILKREYVSKEDIEPTQVDITVLNMKSDGKIHKNKHTENIGADRGKLLPTDIGTLVNQFLMEHFPDIIDYNFTADVEEDFDDIAQGKKDWHKVIDQFYGPFHKAVRTTQVNSHRTSGERLLGVDPKSGKNVYAKIGRFGPVIQLGDTNTDEKPQFASMKKAQSIATISLEEALDLFTLPRTVGEFEGQPVVVSIGRFGPYVRHDSKFYSLAKTDDPYTIDLNRSCEIIVSKRAAAAEKERLKALFPKELGKYESEPIIANIGKYGPYITYKDKNYRLPKTFADPSALRIEDAIGVVREADSKKSATKGRGRTKKA